MSTNLADAIRTLHPNAKFGTAQQGGDFVVIQDSDTGVQSTFYWNTATLGPQPTDDTLRATIPVQILIAYANEKQWDRATGGYSTTISGAPLTFSTDTGSQALIAGKQLRLQQANPPATIDWQTGPTTFVSIPAADFTAAAIKVADFVQSTFDALKVVIAAIQAGTITSRDQIDAYAWPSANG